MPLAPVVANEAPTGTTGSDGLAVFTFAVTGIDPLNHRILVDRFEQGFGVDYTITGGAQVTFLAPSIPVVGAKIWLVNSVAGSVVATGLPGWKTAAEIVSDAAGELGLISADVADPFASAAGNALFYQLLKLLKKGGREIAAHREWKHLVKEFTFATVNGQEAYGLPADFRSLVADTEWNRSSRWPLGLVTSQQWQAIKATTVTSTVALWCRVWQGLLYIYNPPAGQTIAFEYNSTSWVKPNGQLSPSLDAPAAKDDVICFDASLVVARLKMDFRRGKKQDSQSEQDDYEAALNLAEIADSTGRTIYLGGKRSGRSRRLDKWNLPDTIG
jgi:hypothetical protein